MFDEHNHLVSQEQEATLTPAQRRKCQWRRYYKAVLLLHCDSLGERFVIAGVRVLRDKRVKSDIPVSRKSRRSAKSTTSENATNTEATTNETEATAFWPMVDQFIQTAGRGVIKQLVVDRGFINGKEIGRLKMDYGIDTTIPIRSDMALQEDVRGLMTFSTQWEEYVRTPRPTLPKGNVGSNPTAAPHPTVQKREKSRQKTLAAKRAEEEAKSPADPSKVCEKTLIAKFEGLRTWESCPVPLTGVLSRDVYADGHETSWLLVTTNEQCSAKRVRDVYAIRTDIEERNRQIKCFWDLTRFHSTAWSLVVNQTVFVSLTYSLLQMHLLQEGHAALNRRTVETTRQLLPDGERVVVYYQGYFAFFSLMEHMEMTLELEGRARKRALAKTRELRNASSTKPASR